MNLEQRDRLLAVKAKILKAPKSLFMDYFIAEPEVLRKLFKGLRLKTFRYLHCGTVGCIGGHVCGLNYNYKGEPQCDTETRAKVLLGLCEDEARMLFYFPFGLPHKHDAYDAERKALQSLSPGTVPYAKVVAQAIDKCIARNYTKSVGENA